MIILTLQGFVGGQRGTLSPWELGLLVVSFLIYQSVDILPLFVSENFDLLILNFFMEQVDFLISKNQALQIFYLV